MTSAHPTCWPADRSVGTGSFTYRVDFDDHHWRSWTFCPTATAAFALTGAASWTKRKAPGLDLESLSTHTCDPLLDLWSGRGGPPADHRAVQRRTDRTEVDDWWVGATTFVPVRLRIDSDIRSEAGTYAETAGLRLTFLTPPS